MNKKEFLDKLKKETNNEKLVAQYDEFIADRVADGESEESVVASYNLKQIVRMHELEQREAASAAVASSSLTAQEGNAGGGLHNANQKTPITENPIFNLVFMLIGFAIAATCFALGIYFITELVEVLGGYYDHMGEAYVRSEIIGYSISLAFSVIALAAGIVTGVIFTKRFKKLK